MGRIAEALKRAEAERHATATATAPRKPTAVLDPPRRGELERLGTPPLVSDDDHRPEPGSLTDGLSESLVPFYDRTSPITEQYRSLRTRLLSQNPHYEHQTIAITSGVPREGKSVTSLNLGCVLAEIRHLRVLVVDCDFRRGALARMLNQEDSPGLADLLSGNANYSDVLRRTPIPNLSFIACGNTDSRSAAELLASATAKPTFLRMKNDFHYVIVDTPPATTVTDVGIIGQMCSGVIITIRLHRTAEVAARKAVRLLQVNNIPILGCLVIGRDAGVSRYGYGNDYRYYDYYSDNAKSKGGKNNR